MVSCNAGEFARKSYSVCSMFVHDDEVCLVAPPHRSLLTLRSMVHDALAKFDRIYDLQADGRVFETPEELWSEQWLPYTAPLRATTFPKRGITMRVIFIISPFRFSRRRCHLPANSRRKRPGKSLSGPPSVSVYVRTMFPISIDANSSTVQVLVVRRVQF